MAQITHIVFDLGGVLVELDGPPIKNCWLNEGQSFEESWQSWLQSPLVMDFDQGKIPPEDFADQLIEELRLNTSRSAFLEWFTNWPKDFFPGTLELIESLHENYTLGIFSNITELHWPRYCNQLKTQNLITHYFASFEMGLAKPEPEAFKYIVDHMAVDPHRVLFLDDNIINVEAAQNAGLNAQCVKGLEAATRTIASIKR